MKAAAVGLMLVRAQDKRLRLLMAPCASVNSLAPEVMSGHDCSTFLGRAPHSKSRV